MPIPESEEIERALEMYGLALATDGKQGLSKAKARGLITRSYVQNTINFDLTTLRKENGSDDKTI